MIQDKFTFAVLFSDVAWRTDLTMRHTEYFSRKINTDFLAKIIFPTDVDDALDKCETDYLIIQESGNLITDFSFFEKINDVLNLNRDIVLGYLRLAHDYIVLDRKCIVINVTLWKESGKPRFNTQIRQGPRFTPQGLKTDIKQPLEIACAEGDDMYVPNESSTNGAELIVKQLREFGTARSLEGILDSQNFLLDTTSPYTEIHSETVYEKTILASNRSTVFLHDHGEYGELSATQCELLVCPAEGLRAHTLIQHFKPKKVIVYDLNPDALELQKMILQVEQPTLYGELVDKFINAHPSVKCDADVRDKMYVPIKATQGVDISFVVIDACSFEMEDLIKSLDPSMSLLVDFSDIFTYPPNYYKRPLFQIEAIFAELYSLLKSRTSPTKMIGFAPGFISMDGVDLNTSSAQFLSDPTFNPTATDDEGNLLTPDYEPVMFTPTTSSKLKDEKISGNWLSTIREVVFTEPIQKIREVIVERFVDVPREVIVEVPREVIVEVQREVIVERVVDVPREAQRDIPRPSRQPESVQISDVNLTSLVTKYGYAKSSVGGNSVYSKVQRFEEFAAIFEYTVSPKGAWSFKVGKVGKDKRIEFSNGQSEDALIKHMKLEPKINPKTTAKYFQ